MGTHPIFESDFDCLTDKMAETATIESFSAGANDEKEIEKRNELNIENENCEDEIDKNESSISHPADESSMSHPADESSMSHPADVLELEVSPGENDEIDPKTPEPEVNPGDNSSKLEKPEVDPFTTPEVEKKPEMKEEESALANSRVLWITGDLERTMKANDFRVAFSPFGRVESGKLALIGPDKECVGIVTMNTVQGADAVLTNVAEINGRKVKIEKKLRDPTDKNKNKTTQSRQPEKK